MADPLTLSNEGFALCPRCHICRPTIVYFAWREPAVAYRGQCSGCGLTVGAETPEACRARWNTLALWKTLGMCERTPGARRDAGAIPYVALAIDLHSCVADLSRFLAELRGWLTEQLRPDCDEDIDVQLVASAGLHDPRFPSVTAEEEKEPTHG